MVTREAQIRAEMLVWQTQPVMHIGVHFQVHPYVGKLLIIRGLLVRVATKVLVKYAVFLK